MALDYSQLFINQPEDVKAQLPECFRAQLEEGVDKVVIDEEQLVGPHRGGETLRIKAVDFNVRKTDEDEDGADIVACSCRLRLSGKIMPFHDPEGPVLDEKGNAFYSVLYPFLNPDGGRTNGMELPYENRQWLQGFKSREINHNDLLEAGLIDRATKEYLDNRALAWIEFVEEHDGDGQAPYTELDENRNSMINQMAGTLTTSYMAFGLEIRQAINLAPRDRYGLVGVEFEPNGLQRLNTDKPAAATRRTKPTTGRVAAPKTSSADLQQQQPVAAKRGKQPRVK